MEKTIFFGNGLNRLVGDNISWSDLLDQIKGSKPFSDDLLPNTMIYERIILEKLHRYGNILEDEFEVKTAIARLLEDIKGHDIYQELYNANVQHYITTNYDYGFLDSILNLPDVITPIFEYSTEDVYSIRRRKRIANSKEARKNFWQIHGEVRKPATIMLGLDQYCGSIGKLNEYVKGGYKYQDNGKTVIEESVEFKLRTERLTNSSWVELFFASDVHIIGFTFDYSEADLWWLLTRRARMKKSRHTSGLVRNTVNYYCHYIDDQKKSLFESLFVKVYVVPLTKEENKYVEHYRSIIESI